MKTNALKSTLALALLVAAPIVVVQAEETIKVSFEKRNFDSKINSWVEGTIMTIDADSGRLGVRGSKRVYASTYAEMLRDIDAKTEGLAEAERSTKEQEIRQKWATQLDAAREAKEEKEGTFTFYLPEKGKLLKVSDETSHYDLLSKPLTPPVNVKVSENEHKAIMAFKDLKVGERVVVGYESGVIYNNAYVVIKTSANKTDIVQTDVTPKLAPPTIGVLDVPPEPALKPEAKVKITDKIDNELLATIRRSLVEDKNLSTMAHNVNLTRENDMITLKGKVETPLEKTAVERKVAEYVGANHVVNQLDVDKK